MAEPSEQEKTHYYQGLPSMPRLVARSNFATTWAFMWEDNHPVRKTIGNIGNKDVVQDIREKFEPEKMIACLVDTDWTSIDMVRIGTNGNTSDPIILWVGVKSGSLSWVKGIEVACQCRRVLLEAGLDMRCEIRESNVLRAVSHAQQTASNSQRAVPVLSPWSQPGRTEPSLTAALGGQAVAAEKTPSKEGTLTLYLLVNGVKCALVSRHVVVGDDESHINGHHVIMPGQSTYQEICSKYKAKLAACVAAQDNNNNNNKEAYQKLVDHVDTLATVASRRIGHILLSPTTLPGADHIRWLPDYAVVVLDKDRLDQGLSNTIQVDSEYRSQRVMEKYYPNEQLPTGLLHLKDTFPPGDERVGVINEIQSVERAGKGYIHHWVITTLDRSRFFSELGDSGSIIFDLDGRMGGILDAGTGNTYYPVMDLTYLTPITWITEDIEAKAGPVVFL